MLLAVPAIVFIAASTLPAFKSGIFVSAISFNWAFVIVATISFTEFPDPFWTLAAFFNKSDAGGVFNIKVKLLSAYTDISTGITNPALSWVCALNALQNSGIFTPCCPMLAAAAALWGAAAHSRPCVVSLVQWRPRADDAGCRAARGAQAVLTSLACCAAHDRQTAAQRKVRRRAVGAVLDGALKVILNFIL